MTYALLPTIDAVANPDFINIRMASALGPEVYIPRTLDTDETVELLSDLCQQPKIKPQSALVVSLPDILQSQKLLKPFMDFMKRENAIQTLMFCLDVEVDCLKHGLCTHCYMQQFLQTYSKPADAFTEDRIVQRARKQVCSLCVVYGPLTWSGP